MRPPRRPPRGWTVLLVPDEGQGPVHQFSITPRQLERLRGVALLGVLGASLALLAVGIGGLRLARYAEVQRENEQLRARLASIDSKLDRVDDALRRLRLYDSQLRRLTREEVGVRGPLDPEDYARWEALAQLEDTGEPGDELYGLEPPEAEPMDEHSIEALTPHDIQPALLWAEAVEAHAARIEELVGQAEPQLSNLLQDLEDWRSVHAAYPSMWPVKGVLTSGFGYRRSPFTHRWKFHAGIDISAPPGTPIVSPAPGVVTFAGYNAGYGRMIEIDNGYGITSRFAHNTTLYVHEGDVVERGQVIATVGSTGRTTGPHLHYELRIDGQPVDPLDYLPDARVP